MEAASIPSANAARSILISERPSVEQYGTLEKPSSNDRKPPSQICSHVTSKIPRGIAGGGDDSENQIRAKRSHRSST
jgi:hypothetical protein